MLILKNLGQLAILWAIYLLSGYLVSLWDVPVPPAVLGVVILFSLLCFGVIKIEQVEGMADFLLKHLVFFFIPIIAGLMEWGSMFQEHALVFVLAIVVSSVLSLFVCAWLSLVLHRKE